VSADIFRPFVSAIEGSNPELTPANGPVLKLLCDEFRFTKLGRQVQTFTNDWTSVVFGAETVHVLRDKLVQTCSKFRDCLSLLTRPYHVTSSIGADIFRSFVKAIDGVSPTITNENVTDIGLLCDEVGHERLSATVTKFLAQRSSPGERACREIVPLKVQNTILAVQFVCLATKNSDLATRIVDLTTQSWREIALLQAAAFKFFDAERFLVTLKRKPFHSAHSLTEVVGVSY
jgi:hypothetical protein